MPRLRTEEELYIRRHFARQLRALKRPPGVTPGEFGDGWDGALDMAIETIMGGDPINIPVGLNSCSPACGETHTYEEGCQLRSYTRRPMMRGKLYNTMGQEVPVTDLDLPGPDLDDWNSPEDALYDVPPE